ALREFVTHEARDARHELATAARRDFLDPAIAGALGVPPLASLEELWETATPPPVVAADLRIPIEVMPTAPTTRPEPRPRRRKWPALGALSVLRVVAGAVALTLATLVPAQEGGAQPVVVVVDHAPPRARPARPPHAAPAPVIAPSAPSSPVPAEPVRA